MALLRIVKDDDEIIRKKSREITAFDENLARLIDDMKETLTHANGVGLAAVQVGRLKRVVIVDNGKQQLELVNPVIIKTEGEQEELEGCLSCPGKWGFTHRPARVTVEAKDRYGKSHTYTGEDIVARCFCHEIDHLDGILFYDNALRMLTPDEVSKLEEC